MKSILNFVQRHSTWIESLLIYVGAWVMICVNDEITSWHWLLVGLFHFVTLIPILTEVWEKEISSDTSKLLRMSPDKAVLISSCGFIALALMWSWPVSILLSAVPILIVTVIIVRFSVPFVFLVIFSTVVIGFGRILSESDKDKNHYIETHQPETVVVSFVDKSDPDDIHLHLQDQRILRFRKYMGQDLLLAGDTVRILVYENKIIKLER